MRIEEGRLVERPCPDCGNLERRAFGEAESNHGELASYAIGWTSGHEDLVGHITIGIGAGNPGGASFHADVRDGDESWGMGLVDEPFEDVPEGGPDLTRDEALAHEDLDFIWFVADNVMLLDRRAQWMKHYLCGTQAFATAPIVDGTAPVRHVVRDADADWQLLCGTVDPNERGNGQILHLFHALDRDKSLIDVLDLEAGDTADRVDAEDRWQRSKRSTKRSWFSRG